MTLDIYSHLSEEYVQKFPCVTFEKNTIFIPAEAQNDPAIYYILEGDVAVFAHSSRGRSFLVDELGAGDFIGKFSQMRKCNFYCEVVAMTRCRMLDITQYKHDLFNDKDFSLYFYTKTTNKLYKMYKLSLSRDLFNYSELLSYYLVIMADDENNINSRDEYICWKINISTRNYFYILKDLIKKGVIARKGKKISILNMEYLKKNALAVLEFMENEL